MSSMSSESTEDVVKYTQPPRFGVLSIIVFLYEFAVCVMALDQDMGLLDLPKLQILDPYVIDCLLGVMPMYEMGQLFHLLVIVLNGVVPPRSSSKLVKRASYYMMGPVLCFVIAWVITCCKWQMGYFPAHTTLVPVLFAWAFRFYGHACVTCIAAGGSLGKFLKKEANHAHFGKVAWDILRRNV